MKIYSKTLPYGDLPYEHTLGTSKMLVKLFEKTPYIPYLPNLDDLSIMGKTLKALPVVGYKDNKYILPKDFEKFKNDIEELDTPFNSMQDLNKYIVFPALWVNFLHIVKTSTPEQAIVHLAGPMTLANYLRREEHPNLLADKYGRKFLVQAIAIKAMGYIQQIKKVHPSTEVLIVLEDNDLSDLGQLKRSNSDITNDVIINVYTKIVEKIHEAGGNIGVQCFNKCDWSVPISAGVDMISFDAYTNPNNLCIISKKVNEFLANGGFINWGIVPVKSDSMVKGLTIDKLYSNFCKTVENLINEGVNSKLAYNHATVSVQGNLNNLSVMFAEKALILSVQLGKKIPVIK